MIRNVRSTLAALVLAGSVFPATELATASPERDTAAAPAPQGPGPARPPISPSAEAPGVPGDLADLIRRCERAVVVGDGGTLREARTRLSVLLHREGGRPSPAERYAFAYVTWRLNHWMGYHEGGNGEAGREILEEAQEVLEQLVEEEPGNAEAHALLGSVIGEQIGNSMWLGMRLGSRAQGALETAHDLDQKNARVALQRGIGFIFTPRLFGGGVDRAEGELRRAAALFALEPETSPWPNWGRADVHVWLGIILMKREEYPGARRELEAALAIEPEYHWVRDVLLPELGEAESKKR